MNAAQSAGLHIISDQFCPEDNETQFAMLTSHKNPRNLPKNCHQDKTIAIIKAHPDIFFKVF